MDSKDELIRKHYNDLIGNPNEETPNTASDQSSLPPYMRLIADKLPETVTCRFNGCDSPLPPALDGCTVLELGCGTGRNAYIASKLVGPKGRVIGLDWDPDQLAIARTSQQEVSDMWGVDNVEFVQGYIEDLSFLPDGSVDVIVANRIVNLSPTQDLAFAEAWRVLKLGGELYYSSIFSDRRLPSEMRDDLALLAQGIGGASYIEDFRRAMARIGWLDLRWIGMERFDVNDDETEKAAKGAQFVNATVRALKLPDYIEDTCEQYGNFVTYNGGMLGMEEGFVLDDKHTYLRGERTSACGNPCASIEFTRFGEYFTVEGGRDHHTGACCGGVIGKHLKDDCCCGSTSSKGSSSCCSDSSSSQDCCCSDDSSGQESCCCGDSSEGGSCCCGDSDCCSADASQDDPNLEHKQMVVIDYLYLDQSVCDRCQGTDERVFKAVEQLRGTMDMAGYNLIVNRIEIENEELAERFKFLSSPTVRVNGVDICPEVIENECDCCRTLSSYDVYCRQFDFNGKLYEVPPTAYVVKRILEIVFSGEKPSDEPYEIPENIRGFLREKY